MAAHHHQTIEIDYAGRTDCQPVYVGWADPGSSGFQGDPVWSITRIDYDGSGRFVQKVWAMLPGEEKGNNKYTKVWNDRTLYVYN